MKSLVLFLVFFKFVLSLAQVGENSNERWHWTPPPQQNDQVCQNRGLSPNGWPEGGMHHQIKLQPPNPNEGWRPNQGIFNWINPFGFGFPNPYTPWGYHQYQNNLLPRYPPRLPLPAASNLGVPIRFPIQPHFGPIPGQWPSQPHFGPPRGQWHMSFFGPPHGPWPISPHVRPNIPPFYIADRNNYYDN